MDQDMLSAKRVPSTKDKKHKLLFPWDFKENHGMQVRSAFEGRVIHETLIRTKDGKFREQVRKQFPRIFLDYSFSEDPLGITGGITNPCFAKVVPSQFNVLSEIPSDSIRPGFAIHIGSTFEPFFIRCLTPTDHIFEVDSLNAFARGRPGYESIKEWVRCMKDDSWCKLKKFLINSEDHFKDLSKERKMLGILKTIGQAYILVSLFECSRWRQRPTLFESHHVQDDNGYNFVHASYELSAEIVRATEALNREYLSEIGYKTAK